MKISDRKQDTAPRPSGRPTTPLVFSGSKLLALFGIAGASILLCIGCKRTEATAAPKIPPPPPKTTFSLSDASKEIIRQLDAPVEFRFYVSSAILKDQEWLRDYAEVVGEVLDLYRLASNGRITLKRINPRPDSDAEDSANLDGIEPMKVADGNSRYFGLCLASGERKSTLPWLASDRSKLLEYDITRSLYHILNTNKPVVGLLSTLPVWGDTAHSTNAWVFLSELKRDYEAKKIPADTEAIPSDVTILFVHHPCNLKPEMVRAIDQFITQGGRALFFLDPLAFTEAPKGESSPSVTKSGLEPLLKAWGISFSFNQVVVDGALAKLVGKSGGGSERSPGVLGLDASALNTNDAITGGLKDMLFAFSGVFDGKPAAGLQQTVLLHTSDKAQLVDPLVARLGGEGVLNQLKPTGVKYPLAVRFTGQFPSAFPNEAPRGAKGGSAPKAGHGIVLLVGDADCAADALCVRKMRFSGQTVLEPITGNLAFIQNAVDQLACGLMVPATPDLVLEKRRMRFAAQPPIQLPPASQMDEATRSVTNLIRMPLEDGTAILKQEGEKEFQFVIKELESKLAEAQRKINELQTNKAAGERFTLSAEQQQALQDFKKLQATSNEKLKQIRRTLRQRIEALEHLHGITNDLPEDTVH